MAGDENRFMEPLELAGRIIMENGGETYRVEETVTRMGRAFGLRHVESFAVPSGVFVSYRRSDGSNETAVLRVHRGETNLTRVDQVNCVSRLVESRQLSCEEALRRLREIEQAPPPLRKRYVALGAAVSSGGFAVMFGGGVTEFAVAFLVAGLVQAGDFLMERYHMHTLVSLLLGSLITAFLPMAFAHFTGLGLVDAMVAGALMPLLPGLSMTNAVQDTMRGDMVSGGSHGIQAILTAGLIAGGALMASSLSALLFGGAR